MKKDQVAVEVKIDKDGMKSRLGKRRKRFLSFKAGSA